MPWNARADGTIRSTAMKIDGFVGVMLTMIGLCWLVFFMIRMIFSYIVLIDFSIEFLEDVSPAALAVSFIALSATGMATFALAGTRSVGKRIILAAAGAAVAAYHLFAFHGIGATATVVWCAACAVWHFVNGIVAPFGNRKEAARRKHMMDEASSLERNERDDDWRGSDLRDLDGGMDQFWIVPNRVEYCPACGSRLESATIGVTACGRCGTKYRVIMY